MPRPCTKLEALPANPGLQAAILEIVDNQLSAGSPPETHQTLDRLVAAGYAPDDARHLIGQVVVREIFEVLQRGEPYQAPRYLAAYHRSLRKAKHVRVSGRDDQPHSA